MALTLNDLNELERIYLAVLQLGLPPSKLTNDPYLRLDYLTAMTYAALKDEQKDTYLLGEGPDCMEAFSEELQKAVRSLVDKGVLAVDVPPVGMGLIVLQTPEALQKGDADVDPNDAPYILDKFLSGRCLDAILNHPEAYAFLMGQYADSSATWQQLRSEGYADRPGP